jgi:hypothetical protein
MVGWFINPVKYQHNALSGFLEGEKSGKVWDQFERKSRFRNGMAIQIGVAQPREVLAERRECSTRNAPVPFRVFALSPFRVCPRTFAHLVSVSQKNVTVHGSANKVAGTLRVPLSHGFLSSERHTECACYFSDCERLQKNCARGAMVVRRREKSDFPIPVTAEGLRREIVGQKRFLLTRRLPVSIIMFSIKEDRSDGRSDRRKRLGRSRSWDDAR